MAQIETFTTKVSKSHEGKTNSFDFALDSPLFFEFSFVPFVYFVVKALNKVVKAINLKKRICEVVPVLAYHPESLTGRGGVILLQILRIYASSGTSPGR